MMTNLSNHLNFPALFCIGGDAGADPARQRKFKTEKNFIRLFSRLQAEDTSKETEMQ